MPTIVKTGNDGAKRKQLPQIPQDKIPEFIRYCQTLSYPEQRNPSRGGASGGNYYNVSHRTDVAVNAVKLPIKALKPTQNEFNVDKMKGMMKDVEKFKNDIFIVDQDNHIMDGHHRWAAMKAVDPNMLVRVVRIQIPIDDLVRAGHDFEGSYIKGIAEMIKLTNLVPKRIREHCGHCPKDRILKTEDVFTPTPVSSEVAQQVAQKLGLTKFDVEQLRMGMEVEQEHLETLKKAQSTIDPNEATALIASDHLKELPDYYTRLKKMEGE
jgi:hypothetical protein